MDLNFLNPFSDKFLQVNPEASQVRDTEAHLNSFGKGEDSIDWRALAGFDNNYRSPSDPYDKNSIVFENVFSNKRQRINYYRNLALYPFANKLLHIIANECICSVSDGDVTTFDFAKEYKSKFTQSEFLTLRDEFNYVVNCVLGKENVWYYFLKWLIDGEIFMEICLNDKKDRVAGVKILPPYCTLCIWDDGILNGFIEDPRLISPNTTEKTKTFLKNQIAYVSNGEYGNNMNDVRGILERAIRPINQLRAIEDALTVYRITRAPEKRIWNVYAGRMRATEQPEYLQQVRAKYRKQLSLDPHTGMIVGGNNTQSMTEDFWFTKDKDGQGTTVESFKGSTEFNGQIEDVKMFKEQVAECLYVPLARWSTADGAGAQYVQGIDGLSMDEANFQKECKRLRKRFSELLYQVFIVHLQLRGYNQKYLDKKIYNLDFIPGTDFEQMRDIALAEKRASTIGTLSTYLPTLANSKPGSEELPPLISRQFLFERLLSMKTEDMIFNDKTLEREMQEINDKAASVKEEGGEGDEESEDMDF